MEARTMNTLIIPPLLDLIRAEKVRDFEYQPGSATTPIFVLHTSGSTGLPKPMIYTNEFVARLVTAATLPPPDGYVDINRYFRTGKFLITLPPFHVRRCWSCLDPH